MSALFSRRKKVHDRAVAWCRERGVSVTPFNVLTAAFSIGDIRSTHEVSRRLKWSGLDNVHSFDEGWGCSTATVAAFASCDWTTHTPEGRRNASVTTRTSKTKPAADRAGGLGFGKSRKNGLSPMLTPSTS